MAEDQPTNDSPQSSENENISEENTQLQTKNYQLQTETMEVHKHPHHVTHKKKWGEYLLEFFMIFLAVMLGFFAESYREYLSDRSKEKEYIRNIKKDLSEDITVLNVWIPALQERVNDFDSLIAILKKPENTANGSNMYYYARLASRARTFEAINNTIMELQNSGNYRIIINQKALNGILNFQKIINNYLNVNAIETRESELAYPLVGSLFDASVFDSMLDTKRNQEVSELDFASGSKSNLHKPENNPQLRSFNKDSINLLIYYLHQRKSSFSGERRLLEAQKKSAAFLIELLNNEYHL